jgi:hypothetical protein
VEGEIQTLANEVFLDISMGNQGTRKSGCRISENQGIRTSGSRISDYQGIRDIRKNL